jgi:hypothetical protein
MRARRFIHVIVAFAALCASLTRAAQFEYTNDSFSINLPDGWKELQPAEVRALRQTNYLRLPFYGNVRIYQPEKLAAAPFVIIHVTKGERVNDFFMRHLVSTNSSQKELLQFVRAEGVSDGALRRVSFDTNQFTLSVDALRGTGPVRDRLWSKVIFTEDGAVTISALATEPEFANWSATFQQIIDSLRVAPRARYRLREINLSSGSRDWLLLGGVVLAIAVLAGGWIYWTQVRGPSTLEY